MDKRHAFAMKTNPVPDPDTKRSRLDRRFTDAVIGQTGDDADARFAEVFSGIVHHLHTLIRDKKVTLSELYAAIDFIQRAAREGELGLLIGPTGAEAICEEITFHHQHHGKTIPPTRLHRKTPPPTTQTGTGPFYRPFAPLYNRGDSIVSGFETADRVLIRGTVLDCSTGLAISTAQIEVWQAGTNGLYDLEDPEQPEWNLRGRFNTTDDKPWAIGSYAMVCLRPTCYPIPIQGAAGELLRMLDRHPFRPGHIHFRVTANGYLPLVTAIYQENDKYLNSDAVFEVRDSVIARFGRRPDDTKAQWEVDRDFRLVPEHMASREAKEAAAMYAGVN